ncbi:MAG: hypothetical protein BroJett013_30300 [Alphaproteobacteria bacterium]|nr:MAG: hypothetical protein BroJett013_30300 [Alphaproteobacteria bacterium]
MRPSADEIARTLVGACRALGENPELVAAGACPQAAGAYHALAALRVAFPGLRPGLAERLARDWGVGCDPAQPLFQYWGGRAIDADLITRLALALRRARS